MSSLSIGDQRRLVRNLDPREPLEPDSVLYVPREAGSAPLSTAMQTLYDTLNRADPVGGSTQLVTGFPGTGKTTELRRLERFIQADRETPTEVLLIDGEDYIDIYHPLDVVDVLRVLAHTLDRRARALEGKEPDGPDSYWQRFAKFLSTEVDLKQLKLVDGMAELKANVAFRKQVRDALKVRFQVFVVQAHASLRESAERIRKVTGKVRVAILFDSLEKVRAPDGDQAGSVEASLEQVFLQHADLLTLPGCHCIYTFPLGLRYLVTGLGTRYGSEPVVVPMVNFEAEPGMQFLHSIVLRRLEGQDEALFGPQSGEAIRQLARASGGYPRDLIRLVRNLVQQNRTFPATSEAVERVIGQLAEEYARVYRGTYAEVLRIVGTTHGLPQADQEQNRLVARLIQNLLVLAYLNGHEWYDVHPLLKRHEPVKALLNP